MTEHFESDDLAANVEAMTAEDRNALPFGAVRLDANNIVQFFSDTEAEGSGMGHRGQVGRNFFADIAPCLANDDYLGRIQHARSHGEIDIEMGWVGDYGDANSALRVRIMSAPDGGLWIFNLRENALRAA